MLCAYYAQGSWRTLSTHELPDPPRMVLVERRGACPGDGGELAVMIAGTVEPGAVAERARAWLQRGWATAGVERPARLPRPPARSAAAVLADPGDRPVREATARALVTAAVVGAGLPFAVFLNPAAQRR